MRSPEGLSPIPTQLTYTCLTLYLINFEGTVEVDKTLQTAKKTGNYVDILTVKQPHMPKLSTFEPKENAESTQKFGRENIRHPVNLLYRVVGFMKQILKCTSIE